MTHSGRRRQLYCTRAMQALQYGLLMQPVGRTVSGMKLCTRTARQWATTARLAALQDVHYGPCRRNALLQEVAASRLGVPGRPRSAEGLQLLGGPPGPQSCQVTLSCLPDALLHTPAGLSARVIRSRLAWHTGSKALEVAASRVYVGCCLSTRRPVSSSGPTEGVHKVATTKVSLDTLAVDSLMYTH